MIVRGYGTADALLQETMSSQNTPRGLAFKKLVMPGALSFEWVHVRARVQDLAQVLTKTLRTRC